MGINEKWMPSPHYSSSRGPYNVIAFHTTEGAMTIESLGSWFQNPGAGCSSHHGADNVSRNLLGAYVKENNKAWTQGNANNWVLSLEMCAYASWSTSTWMSKGILLDNSAAWLRYLIDKYKIPWTVLSNSQAQSGTARGICQHVNFGSMGSGHHDAGSGFPLAEVIKRAQGSGGSTPTPSTGDNGLMTSSMCNWINPTTKEETIHEAAIWSDGRVCYSGPGTKGLQAVDENSNAKSGLGIMATQSGKLVITYTNQANALCHYEKQPGASKWDWVKVGGSVRLCLGV